MRIAAFPQDHGVHLAHRRALQLKRVYGTYRVLLALYSVGRIDRRRRISRTPMLVVRGKAEERIIVLKINRK